MTLPFIIKANWPAPKNIHAFTTTREGGISRAPYDSFNLATYVNDAPQAVTKNRNILCKKFQLPNEPAWLTQTHSTIAVKIDKNYQLTTADASYTQEKNYVCAVLTADCLPLLICNKAGTEIAAIHAGWRGLAKGVIEATIKHLQSAPHDLLIWLGPAACSASYQVDSIVRDAFLRHNPAAAAGFFKQDEQHWLADINYLARQRLHALNISAIYGGGHCTYTEVETFFSFRRSAITGRSASLIWIS